MISWEDPVVDITWYFTPSGTISSTLVPLCLVQIMFGEGIPVALQVKLAEEPSLVASTLGGTIVELAESKTRQSEKQIVSVK